MAKTISSIEEAIEVFVQGAKINHGGRVLHNNAMVLRGHARNRLGAEYIDQHSPSGRDVLIPLLQHEDDGVRVTVASALLQSRPDLALPVIQDVADYSLESWIIAGMILDFKKVFGFYGLALCIPDPRFPKFEDPSEQTGSPSPA